MAAHEAGSLSWFDANAASPCSLDDATRAMIEAELQAAPAAGESYTALGHDSSMGAWLKAIDRLEQERTIWSLASCVCHPSDDVQLATLRAIQRLGDARVLPLIGAYAAAVAGPVVGSENATLRGLIQAELTRTLASLTGIEPTIAWDDPESVREALATWGATPRNPARGAPTRQTESRGSNDNR